MKHPKVASSRDGWTYHPDIKAWKLKSEHTYEGIEVWLFQQWYKNRQRENVFSIVLTNTVQHRTLKVPNSCVLHRAKHVASKLACDLYFLQTELGYVLRV